MRVTDIESDEFNNYEEFKSSIRRFGFSLSNFYQVKFEIQTGSPLYRELVKTKDLGTSETINLMTLYADEATLPGLQISTGDYRITNTPSLKYAYGSVFSEASFSFIMDADSRIKGLFDIWTNWIYGYSSKRDEIFGPLITTITPKMRTRYRDEYAIDIVIVKYERAVSSRSNIPGSLDTPFSIDHIIPDSKNKGPSKFYTPIPVYAVRLFKAFPGNIGSIALNSGTSELSKLSVSFEYETMTSSVLQDDKIGGSIIDPINGGGDTNLLDLFN
tara:strand:+ start:2143 stop:2961 length:819 start_codon:yes stop_codon:yes gene_type:complete